MEFKKSIKAYKEYQELTSLRFAGVFLDESEDPVFDIEYEQFIDENTLKLQKIFKSEYTKYDSSGKHFYGCNFEVYQRTFEERLKDFKINFPDSKVFEFIKSEFDLGIYTLPFPFIDDQSKKRITYSLERRKEYLENKLNSQGYSCQYSSEVDGISPESVEVNKLSHKSIEPARHVKEEPQPWIGNQTEFIELLKALIQNGNLKGKQKDIIKRTSNFFNIEIKNPDKLIIDIKNRNNGSETLFIDKLKSSLYDYLTKEKVR